jgi:hypothetical protein
VNLPTGKSLKFFVSYSQIVTIVTIGERREFVHLCGSNSRKSVIGQNDQIKRRVSVIMRPEKYFWPANAKQFHLA